MPVATAHVALHYSLSSRVCRVRTCRLISLECLSMRSLGALIPKALLVSCPCVFVSFERTSTATVSVAVAYETHAFRSKAMTALGWINTLSCRLETVPRLSLTTAASKTRALCACKPAIQSKQVQITRQHRAPGQIAVCRSTAVDTAEAEGAFVAFQFLKTSPHCPLQHKAVPCRS